MKSGLHILVTGANGQLGSSLRNLAPVFSHYRMRFTDVDELDITDTNALRKEISEGGYQCLINCAGYTAVDKAESEPALAHALNATAPANLALLSNEFNLFLAHISTDYVFDGKNNIPYVETDLTSPLSVYGKTKEKGETELLKHCSKGLILRTSWLYSEYGNNFCKTILKKCRNGEQIRVVADQAGVPTYAGNLAYAILQILPDAMQLPRPEVFHYSDEGMASWYDFAVAIALFSGEKTDIYPITTSEYLTPAMRPAYSVMNKTKIKSTFNIRLNSWQESLMKGIEDGIF